MITCRDEKVCVISSQTRTRERHALLYLIRQFQSPATSLQKSSALHEPLQLRHVTNEPESLRAEVQMRHAAPRDTFRELDRTCAQPQCSDGASVQFVAVAIGNFQLFGQCQSCMEVFSTKIAVTFTRRASGGCVYTCFSVLHLEKKCLNRNRNRVFGNQN